MNGNRVKHERRLEPGVMPVSLTGFELVVAGYSTVTEIEC
jgi:hypothetical protein